MASKARLFALRFAGLLVCAGVASCLSPTIPLPPPDPPETIASSDTKIWNVSGSCIPGAEVIVIDQRTNIGAVYIDEHNEGQYSVQLFAKECDLATVSQTHDGEASATTGFVVEATVLGDPKDPTACAN